MNQPWGVLFDWDGVVIDSSSQHERSWELLASERNLVLPEGHFKEGFGKKNEVIIPKYSRNVYDHAVRMVGVKIVEVNDPAQLEAACNLFASNAVRRFRTASGDPVAIISAHDNGELRLTLSQPFDEQMVEGFRWPLHPLDDIAVITAVMNELLSACRVAQIEIAPGVLPDLNPAGTPWFPGLREWRSISTH